MDNVSDFFSGIGAMLFLVIFASISHCALQDKICNNGICFTYNHNNEDCKLTIQKTALNSTDAVILEEVERARTLCP